MLNPFIIQNKHISVNNKLQPRKRDLNYMSIKKKKSNKRDSGLKTVKASVCRPYEPVLVPNYASILLFINHQSYYDEAHQARSDIETRVFGYQIRKPFVSHQS